MGWGEALEKCPVIDTALKKKIFKLRNEIKVSRNVIYKETPTLEIIILLMGLFTNFYGICSSHYDRIDQTQN